METYHLANAPSTSNNFTSNKQTFLYIYNNTYFNIRGKIVNVIMNNN